MLLKIWKQLSRWPGGKFIFSRIFIRFAIPYTGSVFPDFLELEPGFAKVQMKDRRAVRNHLHCIHAIALANLGEMTSGLAFYTSFPPATRGIVTGLSIQYLKKARGTLTAEARCLPPSIQAEKEYEIETKIFNSNREIVSVTQTKWKVGPDRKSA